MKVPEKRTMKIPEKRIMNDRREKRVRKHKKERRPLVSAGHILGVGLVCFLLWFLLDARQLYQSATSSPLGVRRSVAMSITRPVARVSEFFAIDRIENGANAALDRNDATPGNSPDGGVPTVLPPTSTTAPSTSSPTTTPHKSTKPTKGTKPSKSSALIAQPTPAHPITVLVVGDSLGEDLGEGMADAIGLNPSVHLVQAAVGDTGLANQAYYNWPLTLESDLTKYHPKIVLIMMGGNDWQSFAYSKTKNAEIATPFWHQQYSLRVRNFIQEATATGAQVTWVGLPQMSPSSPFPAAMPLTLNSVYQQASSSLPNSHFFSSWALFNNAAGQYAAYLPDAKGNLVEVRDADGVHIALPSGSDRLANAVITTLEKQFKIKL